MPPLAFLIGGALAVAGAAGTLACVGAIRAARERAVGRLAQAVESRTGRHGIWLGTWLVGISTSRAGNVRREADSARARNASPAMVLALWKEQGARLLAHLPGPTVSTEVEACGWLAHASDDLADYPLPPLVRGDGREVFALVYATTTPPPAPATTVEALGGLLGEGCLGVAFVACTTEMDPLQKGLALRMLSALRWAFAAAALGGVAWAGVAAVTEPVIGPEPPPSASSTSPTQSTFPSADAVVAPALPDGGARAGGTVPEGGAPDAGDEAGAGLDDAGASDASAKDAGAKDAGAKDAGRPKPRPNGKRRKHWQRHPGRPR